MIPTPEQLSKLPKWAQDYIKDRDTVARNAVSVMVAAHESQTPTPFYFSGSMWPDPDSRSPKNSKVYVGQDWRRSIAIEFGGIILDITCRENVRYPSEIGINFRTVDRLREDVMLIPNASNSITFRLPRKDQ